MASKVIFAIGKSRVYFSVVTEELGKERGYIPVDLTKTEVCIPIAFRGKMKERKKCDALVKCFHLFLSNQEIEPLATFYSSEITPGELGYSGEFTIKDARKVERWLLENGAQKRAEAILACVQ